jgi:protoheme IX farnesyltransferase
MPKHATLCLAPAQTRVRRARPLSRSESRLFGLGVESRAAPFASKQGKELRTCGFMKDYIELTKPSITWLILMSTAVGYYFGIRDDWRLFAFFHTILGTGLLASGTATLNEWYERAADAKMRRTRNRPIPSGRVTPARALIFGIALSILGFVDLVVAVNPLAALCGLFTLATYLFFYTPLKQRSRHATTIGAFPGAMPPLIGYAGAAGTLTAEAWVLFGILFLWQFPHFLSIAWMYREDYSRAGMLMLPVVEPDGRSTARQMVVCSLLLIPVSLLPAYLSMTGGLYQAGALALGLIFLYAGLRVAFERTVTRARQVLLASVVYLPLLYGLMLFDRPRL